MQECIPCDFKSGSIIDGTYVVDGILGEGSFGIVYRVHNLRSTVNITYALKLLKLWTIPFHEREKVLLRFDQEYETGRIRSPYLVQSLDKGMVNGNPYIVMEFCPGGDLLEGVKRGKIDLPKAASEILMGLKALHINGKVHRDLKPENVLMKEDGVMALTDFGIAGDRNKRLTERGVNGIPAEQMGTYAFMPPEQVNPKRGDATVLPTTDMFAFGVLMYRMLTGKYPFGSVDTQPELYKYVMRAKEGQWDRNGLLAVGARDWMRLLDECLKPDFNERLQSAEAALTYVPESSARNNAASEMERVSAAAGAPPIVNGVALRIMQGEEYGKVYYLTDMIRQTGRRILTVGRIDPEVKNMIAIREDQSNYISRMHCTIEYYPESDSWLIRDGQWDSGAPTRWRISMNGTYVGSSDVPVSGLPVNHGDIISVGDAKLRLEGY